MQTLTKRITLKAVLAGLSADTTRSLEANKELCPVLQTRLIMMGLEQHADARSGRALLEAARRLLVSTVMNLT